MFQQFDQIIENLNYSIISSPQCKLDTRFWLDSVKNFNQALQINCSIENEDCLFNKQRLADRYLFAIKQFDAFGRAPAELLSMTSIWMGSWNECLNVHTDRQSNYTTKFCYVYLSASIPITSDFLQGLQSKDDVCDSKLHSRWSVCVPRSCPEKDVTSVFRSFNDPTFAFKFCKVKCRPPTLPVPDTAFWIVISTMAIIIVLTAMSSIFDYCTNFGRFSDYRKSIAAQCFLKFSFYTNAAEIMSITKKPNRIHCLNSIRTITITWVMAGHLVAFYLDGDNTLTTLENTIYILNDVFTTAYIAVDTFFFLSGLLLGYIFYRTTKKSPKIIKSPVFWILYYVHRYLRLSPPYFLFIAFVAVISDYVTFGPILFYELISGVPCRTQWWRNVLYINKMYDNGGECLPHSWYLAADMQMYIFAPLILVPLFLSPIAGYSLGLALILITIAVNYGVYFKHDFPANYIGYFSEIYNQQKRFDYDQLVYYAVWLRFTPYLVGIFTGYFLFRTEGKKLRLHWVIAVILWIASFLIGFACVYSLYDYFQGPSHKISTFSSASYSYWSRLGWALALGWVVIACEKKWAGPIKNFMEQGFWNPFGRLTYCAYLTHGVTLPLIHAINQRPVHYVTTTHAYVHEALPLFVTTFIMAFFWCVFFEVPFAKLEIMLTGMLVGKSAKPESVQSPSNAGQNEKVPQNLDITRHSGKPDSCDGELETKKIFEISRL